MSEPWLRGPIPGVDPLLTPMFHTFEQARQELRVATEALTADEIWATPGGAASIGFHIRHAGGAAERLCTYLRGEQLSDTQVAAMKSEGKPGASREELLAGLDSALGAVEEYVRGIDTAILAGARGVGRKMLPTTVIGLITHIAEHTLRHTGQAVTTAKVVRAAAC
jgi:hypothetical protein